MVAPIHSLRTVVCMSKIKNHNRSTAPSSDGTSDLSSNSQQAFRLIAQQQNIDSQYSNSAEIIRALYEGSINPNEIALSFIELNCKEDADSKKPCLLSLPEKFRGSS